MGILLFSLPTRSWLHFVTSSKAGKERSREETLGVWRLFVGKKSEIGALLYLKGTENTGKEKET